MEITTPVLDSAFWIMAGGIALLLMMSAFFSGSETALTAASRGKLRTQADKGNRGAKRALKITEDSERLIGSVLLGNNLVNILATSLATSLLTQAFGDSGVALATLVMTLLVLIFAEVLPKTYAITAPETAASRVSGIIQIVVVLFAPVVSAVRLLVRGVLRILAYARIPTAKSSPSAKKSQARCSLVIPKGSWKKKTATGSSARSIWANARLRKSCCTARALR